MLPNKNSFVSKQTYTAYNVSKNHANCELRKLGNSLAN